MTDGEAASVIVVERMAVVLKLASGQALGNNQEIDVQGTFSELLRFALAVARELSTQCFQTLGSRSYA